MMDKQNDRRLQLLCNIYASTSALLQCQLYEPNLYDWLSFTGMQVGDTVAIYGDVNGQCRRGYTQKFTGDRIFIGNGQALMNRAQLFVETGKPRLVTF